MLITLIGHSTVLIEAGGKKVLTDPWFTTQGNGVYRRPALPAPLPDRANPIDLVLVSHTHFDHVDPAYFSTLPQDVPVLLPEKASRKSASLGIKHAKGMAPWQHVTAGELTITAVPALHYGDCLGYVIQSSDKTVYFSGDTFYAPFMHEIGRKFKLDAALIPVTTSRFPTTMGESSAVRGVKALGTRAVLPIHLGLQSRLFFLRTGQSVEGFIHRLLQSGMKKPVVVLKEGESWRA